MITADRLREVLGYDPITGRFTWRKCVSNRSPAGSEAGCVDKERGYVRLGVDGAVHLAHRLAWLYVTGEFPVVGIDHINGARSDNRFANLRPAAQSENCCNRGRQANNTSGFKGVTKNHDKWMAQIHLHGIRHYLGTFDSKEHAHGAYASAAARLHGEFARVS